MSKHRFAVHIMFMILTIPGYSSSYIPNHNHDVLTKTDDKNSEVNLARSFFFKGASITKLYISPNGGIRTSNRVRVDPTDPMKTYPDHDILPFFIDSNYNIACADCNLTSKVNPASEIQSKIDSAVRKTNAAGDDRIAGKFSGDSARTLIVTWHKSPSYYNNILKNTFQAILTSDGRNSFGIFTYVDLQYPSNTDYRVQVKVDDNQYVMLVDSRSSDKPPLPEKLLCRSNAFLPGTWVVKLGENFNYTSKKFTSSCSHCVGEETWKSNFSSGQKLCGSNYQTYNSKEELEADICRTRGDIYLLYSKECACNSNPCMNNGSCSNVGQSYKCNCTSDFSGPQCKHRLRPTPPRDEDCSNSNGGCSDICRQSGNKVICSCTYGGLMADNKTCDVTDYIFFSSTTISIFNPASIAVKNVGNANGYVLGMTYDYSKKNVFIALYNGNSNNPISYLDKYSLKTQSMERLLVLSGAVIMENMAFDPTRETIYYSDYYGGVKMVTNVYSSIRSTSYVATFVHPRGLALDFCRRLLFVADWGAGKIFKLDENNQTKEAIADGLNWVNALTLDSTNYKLYWGDAYYDIIEEANYDGSCRRTVSAIPSTHIFAMTSWNGYLFWTDWTQPGSRIYRTEVSSGKSEVIYSSANRLYDILTYQNPNAQNCSSRCKLVPQPLNQSNLFDYGPKHGDSQMDKKHYLFHTMKLPKNIPLFGEPVNELYIFNAGFISVGSSNISIKERTLSHENASIISVYKTELTTTRFYGGVYYRISESYRDRAMAYDDIRNANRSETINMPDSLVIVTWSELALFYNGNKRNTFQLVIASDSDHSYVIYRYQRLDIAGGLVGFSNKKCVDYMKVPLQRRPLVFLLTNRTCDQQNTTTLPTIATTHADSSARPTGTRAITYATTSAKPTGSGTLELYPLDGDRRVPPGDDTTFAYLYFPDGMPLFSNLEYSLSISVNGYVTVNGTERAWQPIIPDRSKTKVLIYANDFITSSGKGGDIFYRKTNDSRVLARASADISLSKDAINFNPTLAVVVTYQNVSSYGLKRNVNTFQMVLATDYTDTFLILLYKHLEKGDAVVGFNEKSCDNYKIINFKNNSQLLTNLTNVNKQGMFVYKLSQSRCRKAVPVTPQIILAKTFSSYSGEELVYSVRTAKPAAAVFVQLISRNSPISAFITNKSNYMSNAYNIKYIYNSIEIFPTTYITQFLILTAGVKESNRMQYGNVFIPLFSSRTSCTRQHFNKIMNTMPIIKLSGVISYNKYSKYAGFTSLWLRNVSVYTFDICYREMFSFTGPRYINVYYLALSMINQVDYSNDTFTESGIKLFKSGPLNELISNPNERSCQSLKFRYRYGENPYVFVTPEDLNSTHGEELVAWVKSVSVDNAVICAKSSTDMLTSRLTDIKVHYVVKGSLDKCSMVNCPSHLECQRNYNGTVFCGCIRSCRDAVLMPFCGTDLYTYTSMCAMNKRRCELFGPNETEAISMAYTGECKHFPYMNGKIKLDPVPAIPVVFCKEIKLNKYMFHRHSRMHILLTVTWDKSFANATHDATASWSEDVSIDGFKACVLVAGRHFFGIADSPSVYWVAYQGGLSAITSIDTGVISMPTWYTGTMCQIINIKSSVNYRTKVLLGVEHSIKNYRNAMTAWIERFETTTYLGLNYTHKVCARELQNFDGLHEGINIHYLVLQQSESPYLSEVNEIIFPRQLFYSHSPISSICQISSINRFYPSLPNPTIMLTSLNVSRNLGSPHSLYSNNDLIAWLESTNHTHMKTCVKSLRAGFNREEIRVSYVILPALCEPGWYYHDGNCFTINETQQYSRGRDTCMLHNASLPIADSASKNHFVEMLAAANDSWIGYTDKEIEGLWKWDNGSTSLFRRWGFRKPDGGRSENCAVIDTSSIRRGWDDRSCNDSNKVICEKDSSLGLRACQARCLNGGSCVRNSYAEMTCICPPGYDGKMCELNVLEQRECRNFVYRDEPWRLYENKTTTFRNKSCDHQDLISNTTWYRFKNGKLMETFCPNATSRCGHAYPGWLNKRHPTVSDGIVELQIFYYEFFCASDYGRVRVRNCGKFYVYQFTYLPFWSCDYGICTVPY